MKIMLRLLILIILFSLKGYSQEVFTFDKDKWVNDTCDSITSSYRGKVSAEVGFYEMLEGKTKKEIVALLGKPDDLNKKSFVTKKTVGYVYCIDKTTIERKHNEKRKKKCNKCKRSSITIIVTKGVVVDFIIIYAGG
ncbi:MAG: hypothetical protein JEZ03_13600 [Bacteroidales bacterium]|nr:hypothetical protein [Bacteroidales bacterium]